LDLLARLGAEIFWFQEVGYLQVLQLRLTTQTLVWVTTSSITALYLLGNLEVARRLKYTQPLEITRSLGVKLNWLLPSILGLNLLVGLLVTHYSKVARIYWQPTNFSLPSISPPIPALFNLESVWEMCQQLGDFSLTIGLVLSSAIALLIYPQLLLNAIALLLSAIMGLVLSGHWANILQYLRPTAFNLSEPLFNRDISFYIFTLPIWRLVEFWLVGLCLYGLIAVALTYLQSGDSLSQGRFRGFSRPQQQHLLILGSCFMSIVAFSYRLSRYELLYSTRGVAYGASYTDIAIQLPGYTLLSILGVAIAILLLARAIAGSLVKKFSLTVYGLGLYITIAIFTSFIFPVAVQRLIVQPNELARERPYIERSIALTRQAFDLENIETRAFNPEDRLTYADIQANALTIKNIRLWDRKPLLDSNRQLQQIRLYYQFPDADIDRYTLQADAKTAEKRQTLIAARELDYSSVPGQAQTWVNKRLVYTHGYGFTLSPVNTVAPSGLPEYFIKDIGGDTALDTSSAAINASIPIGQPRIYYGEIANTYIMTGTKVEELDYPSGNDNVYNTYDGRGGINIGSFWRKSLFAKYLNDWQMLLTRNFLPDTKVLFRRNINQRIREIAPFLQYDGDPYLVVADTKIPGQEGNYLYWVVDAYTTSDRYPYADRGAQGINYIRNSVKVVIDAYHGSVDFYIADKSDPIINTWQQLFPKLFKPLSAMPATLRSHLRYPVDFFNIQS